MTILYYIPTTIAFFASALFYWGGIKAKHVANFLLAILMLFLVIVVGLRYNTGSDWDQYVKLFGLKEFDFSEGGIAFYLIKVALRFFSLGIQSYVLLMFLLSMITKIIAFKRESIYYIVVFMLYLSFWYLTLEFNQIRQGAALGFSLLSLKFIREQQLKQYLLFVFIAFALHNSAIAFLPLYWLVRIKINRLFVYIILLITLTLAFSGVTDRIIAFLVSSSLSDSYYTERIVSYTLDEIYNQNVLFSFTTIHKLFILIVITETVHRYPCDNISQRMLLWASLAGVVVFLLFCQYEIIATRLALYFRSIELISLAYLPFIFKRKKSFVILVILYLYSIFQINNVMSIIDNGLIPYHNFLF